MQSNDKLTLSEVSLFVEDAMDIPTHNFRGKLYIVMIEDRHDAVILSTDRIFIHKKNAIAFCNERNTSEAESIAEICTRRYGRMIKMQIEEYILGVSDDIKRDVLAVINSVQRGDDYVGSLQDPFTLGLAMKSETFEDFQAKFQEAFVRIIFIPNNGFLRPYYKRYYIIEAKMQ